MDKLERMTLEGAVKYVDDLVDCNVLEGEENVMISICTKVVKDYLAGKHGRPRLEELEKNDRNKDMLAEKIYNTIYRDKKPKQEMSAKLECLVLAEDVLNWFCAKFGKPKEDYTTHAIAEKLGVELWKVMELGKYFKEKFGRPREIRYCVCKNPKKKVIANLHPDIGEYQEINECKYCDKPIDRPSINRERLVEIIKEWHKENKYLITEAGCWSDSLADAILKEGE